MNKLIKNLTSKLFLLCIMFASIGFAEIKIDYPDLSSAKPIIKERQKELYAQLEKAKSTKSGYELAEVYGLLGEFYHAHDYLEVAAQLYNNSAQLAPYNAKWHYLLGVVLKSLGNFSAARDSFFRAWKENNQYYPTMIYLAEILMQQGELQQAKQYYEKILSKDSKYAKALVNLGQVYVQLGEAEKAIENYKKALAIQPIANHINFLLSQAYASIGNIEEAEKYNKLKGKNQVEMYDPLMLAMLEESRSSSYYNDNSVRAYYAKNFVAAERLAKKAVSYDPASPYAYVTLANIYVSTNRAELASQTMEKVVAEHQQDPNLKYSLGVIEEILGDDKKAIYWYRKTLELNENHKQASITLPSALMREGKYDEALVALEKASQVDSNNSFLVQRAASIYAHQNNCPKASQKIYQAVKSQPKNFAFLLTFVKVAVHCDVTKEMVSDALNAARNMYEFSQDNYVVETLAMIEAKSNNFKNAVDYQTQAMFQVLTTQKQKEQPASSKKEINRLKRNLKLYKEKKYPQDLFSKDDIDLNPQRIQRVK